MNGTPCTTLHVQVQARHGHLAYRCVARIQIMSNCLFYIERTVSAVYKASLAVAVVATFLMTDLELRADRRFK